MTLIVAATGPESLWLLADRRISYDGRLPRDDARKLMFLQTSDGLGILGYSGLGATAGGTEPADWMSAVLRGIPLSFEGSLGVLAKAIEKRFPPHLAALPWLAAPTHNVLVPAFVNNETRLYSIDLTLSPDRLSHQFRWTRYVSGRSLPAKQRAPRLAIAGSGAAYLLKKGKAWMRELLRVVTAYDRSRISGDVVANRLAALNSEVHSEVGTVGPSCIVAWRNRTGGHHGGGGAHHSYTHTARDAHTPGLPVVANGQDVGALLDVLFRHFSRAFEAREPGKEVEMDYNVIDAELARLPDKPDETLR